MARKKKEAEPMPAVAPPELKPVRVDLSPDVHKLLRLVSADAGVSMASFARAALEQVVRVEAKNRGLKG